MAISETPGKMYALATVLSVLAILAVILRFHAKRLVKSSRIEWDDYMISLALVFTLGTGICMFVGAALGDLGRHTRVDADNYPEFTPRTVVFQKTAYISLLTQTFTFGFTKLAVLLFYRRIFTNGRVVYAIWAMIGIVNIWTVGFFLSNLLQCIPISANWTNFGAAPNVCIDTNMLFLAQCWSDVLTDVLILSLPIPCIWQLQMPTSRKIAICGIFLLGTLVVAAGIAKLAIFYNVIAVAEAGIDNDVTYILTPTLYWPMVEASLGVVGACLPTMRPLFRGLSTESLVRPINHIFSAWSNRARGFFAPRTKARVDDDGFCKSCGRGPPGSQTTKGSRNGRSGSDTTLVEEARAKNNIGIYDVEKFDDLPDFPDWEGMKRNVQRGAAEGGMV